MRPLDGRQIWFAGIGGAGLSGYAALAQAWGARVAGWDRAETPYLRYVRDVGIRVVVAAHPPQPPAGWEVVVSSAFAGSLPGRSRAELLAELVALRDSIVVAGAHGKTTTAAMVAFALRELGRDPAFVIGGEVPQLGGNAGTGAGWLVVEGDESDRTIGALRPRIAVVTNVDLDHHSEFASRADVESLFESWLRHLPVVVRGDGLNPVEFPLAVAGEHNRLNAACALAALEAAGVPGEQAAAALGAFSGVARRLERRGEARGISVYDDYAHNPAKIAAAVAAAREAHAGRVHVLFQPHLFTRTRHAARQLADALSTADVVAVADVYPAREQPVDGVTGKLVVDALAERRAGMLVAWTPDLRDGARFLAARARQGDVVLTIGAGDVDRAVPLVLSELG